MDGHGIKPDTHCPALNARKTYAVKRDGSVTEITSVKSEPGKFIIPGWRPIRTAPRDESWVLIRIYGGSVRCARYMFWEGCWRADDNTSFATADLTHWMPLPEVPQSEENAS